MIVFERRSEELNGHEPVLISAKDAEERGLSHGDIVRLYNARGALLAAALPTKDVKQGVAIISTGSWFYPSVDGDHQGLDKRGNPDVLTRDKGASRLSQGTTAQPAFIQIEKYRAEVPPVTAFDIPDILSKNSSWELNT